MHTPVAEGSLTDNDRPAWQWPAEYLGDFGAKLREAYPMPEDESFYDLLRALDKVDSNQTKK
jgi:hypothetical protein